MEPTEEQIVFDRIIREAWENYEFKQELINSPLDAIEELTGKKLIIPEGKTFVVKDQSDESNIYFNIPAKPSMEDVELNDEQLDIVAGGSGTNSPIIIVNGVSDVTVQGGGS
ncbi:hypothetical protein BTO06_17990 [Tenacibaculum sp. SZ-18]|uniref:NHLP leader peptide family RiPP precursor n=1 Tax=Tenacibaculum sp. SZ-18 TaxID=754423 RepID=UPI000C2D4BB9|nr:NHLP leader peptide family RiPP precursor [Tenacibaculum sp. SZ-18]AUC16922.1 hypothetical protein BTO06_17990 [Tenacibaculum sp. SZ-18]